MDSPAFSSENNTKTEDEVELYQIKIESMQKYVSFLNQLIEKLEQDASDEKKLIQMKIFQKMLTNNEKSRWV